MTSPIDKLQIPYFDDFHVHLRQGVMMKNVVPDVQGGGAGVALVMPNLNPPITTTDMAIAYRKELEELDGHRTQFLMTLYLSPSLTGEEIRKAAAAGVVGVKSYPRGVTTNSEAGIESYEVYYPIFEVMQECDMVLNLHGEVPSGGDCCVMNAEQLFLVHLQKLHHAFPKLRIVLEHATTAAAVRMVQSLGPTVACTITVHHLALIVDDWAGQPHHFCKPVAKLPSDREALRQIVLEGHPRFFLGSDSAPHLKQTKECAKAHAGVYTSCHLAAYLAHVFESFGALDRLHDFACTFGRRFYKLGDRRAANAVGQLLLVREPFCIPRELKVEDVEAGTVLGSVVPFMAGQTIQWRLEKVGD